MPHDHPQASPKDVFLHLLGIGTLYFSIIQFLVLLFEYINHLFPDPIAYVFGADADSVRFASASLIILFPVYLLVSWMIQKDIRTDASRAGVWVRHWLLYLTLFIAAIVIIVDLVVLVWSFLNGDITARFLLKVAVVFAVAAAVFGYEFWDLRRTDFASSRARTIGLSSLGVVFVSIVVGFFIIGSPWQQRKVRFDDRRITDLQSLQSQIIDVYWLNKNILPPSLDALKNDITGFVPPLDPGTKAAYEYAAKGPLTFQLCAVFETVSQDQPNTAPYASPNGNENWKHKDGRVCFSRTIDPDLYKTQRPAKF